MKRFEDSRKVLLARTGAVLGLAAVFAADLATPRGFAVWMFYLVPIALTLFDWRPRAPLYAAAAATAFVVVTYALSPAFILVAEDVAQLNRAIAVVAFWALAGVARQFIVAKIALRERDWVRTAHRQLAARMQGEQTLPQLGDVILGYLCPYLDVPVAALYATDDDGTLRRCATYAAGPLAAPDAVQPGEGLVGQAAKDRQLLRLDDVPAGHLPVASALGSSAPRHIVVLPVLADEQVKGVLELGFVHRVGNPDLDLLQAVAGPVAIAIRSAQHRARQLELLEQTQRQAAALQVQEEELRVSNEELQEQSRALKQSQAQLEAQQAELEQTNAQLEAQAESLEHQRDELARARLELLDKAESLERANQYKSEFLANMSHELRTPLNSALILAKLLADNKDGNLSPEQVKFASSIYASGNDLLVLINDILDLSRVEAGQLEIRPEEASLAAVADALRKTFEPMAGQKKLALAIDIDPALPAAMRTDPLRLQQILRNLLSNALKFTEQGRVSLAMRPADGARIAFVVEDTGIGIPADQHEVIFDAFRQADGSTHRKYGGTGLGLTISRELTRRLGGTLTLDSEVGRGSTFTATLPLRLEEPAGEAPAPSARPERPPAVPRPAVPGHAPAAASVPGAPAGPPAQGQVPDDRHQAVRGERTLLVVEDDPRFAAILRDLARELHFRCLVATTAAEGRALAEQYLPSAMLLDVHLPDHSGLVLLDQLKRSPATRHIPAHVMSVADYAQQARELGAIGYALKPVRREQLVSAIERLEQKLAQKVRRVLVVEDAEAHRESIVALLRQDSVEIASVGTGGEALQRLQRETFDCMVLDLVLPDMSGYDVLEKMGGGDAFSFPPVIVYTGRSLSREEEQRLQRFASSVIIKGARSPERLLDEVSLFLHQVESTLPPRQQQMLRAVRQRDAAFEGRNILVVEDDARNIFALSSILEPKGAKLRIARNGREALDLLDAVARSPGDSIDLVLMDIMMPVMDGLAATREIRRREPWRRLPIIALTAKAMSDDRLKCLEAGASDYIAKPLEVDKLLSLAKVWLPK